MKRSGLRGAMMLLTLLPIILFYTTMGGCEGWIRINPSGFDAGGGITRSFQDAIFDANNLYVITSDSAAVDDVWNDPNRKTSLWVATIPHDPNQWGKAGDNRWSAAPAFGSGMRLDTLFSGGGMIYIGLTRENGCEVYLLNDPNNLDKNKKILMEADLAHLKKSRIDNGEVFQNNLYVGIYEKDYGCRIYSGSLSENFLKEVISQSLQINLSENIADIINVSIMKWSKDKLLVGFRKDTPFAPLYYYPYGFRNQWYYFKEDEFKNSYNQSSSAAEARKIIAHVSIAEFLDSAWLLTEFENGEGKGWCLWDSNTITSDSPVWRKRYSSHDSSAFFHDSNAGAFIDPNCGPFQDPNIIFVTGLQSIGEYLYIGCLLHNHTGKVWKGYRGKEWIRLPSACFDPNNHLISLFSHPQDNDPNKTDYIFAGTHNENGAQLLMRFVPKIDFSGFSMEDRFLGPARSAIPAKSNKIKIAFAPNWNDAHYWANINNIPSASLYSLQRMDGNREYFANPNKIKPESGSIWDFTPQMLKEGVYTVRWEMRYGDEGEKVIKHLTLAWDVNAPTAPQFQKEGCGVGDESVTLVWGESEDNFKKGTFEDANFKESLKGYELGYWKADDPNGINRLPIASNPPIPLSSNSLQYRMDGLQNYIIYRFRVRAIDKAGNKSVWSDEIEKTPKPTIGWTDLVNEKGGCFINSIEKGKKGESRERRRWFAGIKGGQYETSSHEADPVYGGEKLWPVHLEIGWVHRERLEIGVEIGYMEMSARALLADTLEKSTDKIVFRFIPCSLNLRWSPFQTFERFINPYLGAGIDGWWYQEDKLKRKDKDGWKYGYHITVGLRFLLDRFDPYHAQLLYDEYKVKDTSFIIEGTFNGIDNFGKSRLDPGGFLYQAGILFHF